MAIDDAVTVMGAILQNNSNITSLLGKFQGTTIPLIKSGRLPEQETDLPAITYNLEFEQPENFLNNISFIVNCYAGNTDANSDDAARNSYLLAQTVKRELNQMSVGIDGYQARTTVNILTQVVDPAAKEVNTPVSVRIVNIFN